MPWLLLIFSSLLIRAQAVVPQTCVTSTPKFLGVAATAADCPPGDTCDPSLLQFQDCVISCSSGQLKFIDHTGQWTVAMAKATFNVKLAIYIKSSGGAGSSMEKATCIGDPNSVTTITATTTTTSTTPSTTTTTTTKAPPKNFPETCAISTPKFLGVAATAADCSPGDTCDPSRLLFQDCVISCSSGQLKFIDHTGQWTVAMAKATFNVNLGVFIKSSGGAGSSMAKATCIVDPSSVTTTTSTTTTTTTSTTTTTAKPTTTTTTTQPPVPTKGPACGCNYNIVPNDIIPTLKKPVDNTKLFVQYSFGTNNAGICVLQCDTGYRVVNWDPSFSKYTTEPFTSLSCFSGQWTGIVANTDPGRDLTSRFSNPYISCEPENPAGTCSESYSVSACRAGQDCDSSKIRAIQNGKSTCLLSCGLGYALFDKGLNRDAQEIYFYSGKWFGFGMASPHFGYIKVKTPNINCERYFDPDEVARQPPADAITACGCPYKYSGCPTCDWKGLYVAYGVGATSGKCTLACSKGYVLEGDFNFLSCKDGVWTGSSRSSLVSTRLSASITTSCIAAPSGTCAPPTYKTFECAQCDISKLISLPSTKGECVLTCDKGYQLALLRTDNGFIKSGVQEAVLSRGVWIAYALGDAGVAMRQLGTIQVACEVAQPEPPIVTTPAVCGCPYKFRKCDDGWQCENGKMVVRHEGAGTCTMLCDAGYILQTDQTADGGFISTAVCAAHKWFARGHTFSGQLALMEPQFTCVRIATTKCDGSYSLHPEADKSEASKLQGFQTWSRCRLSCAAGYQLWVDSTAAFTNKKQFAEISLNDQGTWTGLLTSGKEFTLPKIVVRCLPVPTSVPPLAQCGCPYASGGPGQLVPRSVWPDGGSCELICQPGYSMYNLMPMSLVVCQGSKWVGRDSAGKNIITMPAHPTVWCNKTTTDYFAGCTNLDWRPLMCPSCSVDALLPVPSGYTCQFTCRAGWRLVAMHSQGAITRPRAVALRDGSWIGTGGQGLRTTLYYGTRPLISCERDTQPVPADPPVVNPPPAKPCEYCKQPIKQTLCPPGKSCAAEFAPLWVTTANCMQIRCLTQRTMLINNGGAWISTDAINCEADGNWKTASGVTLLNPTALTCDAKTTGNDTDLEAVYKFFKAGLKLIALDPSYQSPIAG